MICSFLYTEGLAGLGVLVPLAFLGSTIGDHVGFYAGRLAGPSLHRSTLGQRYADRIERGEAFIRRWGWGAIIIGRFIPALRSIIPAMSGVARFPRLRYTLFDFLACGLWAGGLALILAGIDTATR